jgi:hypothetical protein
VDEAAGVAAYEPVGVLLLYEAGMPAAGEAAAVPGYEGYGEAAPGVAAAVAPVAGVAMLGVAPVDGSEG